MPESSALLTIVATLSSGAFGYLFREIAKQSQKTDELKQYCDKLEAKLLEIGLLVQGNSAISTVDKGTIISIIKQK